MRAVSIAMVYIASLGAITYAIESGYVESPGLLIITWAALGIVLAAIGVLRNQ